MFKHFQCDRADCDTPKVIAGQGFAIALFGLRNGNDIVVPITLSYHIISYHIN